MIVECNKEASPKRMHPRDLTVLRSQEVATPVSMHQPKTIILTYMNLKPIASKFEVWQIMILIIIKAEGITKFVHF